MYCLIHSANYGSLKKHGRIRIHEEFLTRFQAPIFPKPNLRKLIFTIKAQVRVVDWLFFIK